MTLKDLQTIGKYLYGERWKTPLAAALGMSLHTLKSVAYGSRKLNDKTINDVYQLAADKQIEVLSPFFSGLTKTHNIREFELELMQLDIQDNNEILQRVASAFFSAGVTCNYKN